MQTITDDKRKELFNNFCKLNENVKGLESQIKAFTDLGRPTIATACKKRFKDTSLRVLVRISWGMYKINEEVKVLDNFKPLKINGKAGGTPHALSKLKSD